MTPTEREEWLRDRGVLIETANDRRTAEALLSGSSSEGRPMSIIEQVQNLSLSSTSNATSSSEEDVGIKFVHIPHDTSKPITTLNLPKRLVDALGPAGDIIPTYVKSFFADGKSIDETLFKEQAAKQNLVGGDIDKLATKDTSNPANVTSSALTNATREGSVETFALVRPSSTNHYQGEYIYLDEVGLLKHLPNNSRASKLAGQCGYHPPPNFYGDVFVGRVSSKPMLHNSGISKEDVVDTSKEWMVRAPQENVAWQQALNEATGRTGETQPSAAGTEGVAVQVDAGDDDSGVSYSWTQNEEEIESTIPLSSKLEKDGGKVNKAKIKVVFQLSKIAVKYGGEQLLEVKLYSKLDTDGCTWTLDKDTLVVTGEKATEGEIWPRLEQSGG